MGISFLGASLRTQCNSKVQYRNWSIKSKELLIQNTGHKEIEFFRSTYLLPSSIGNELDILFFDCLNTSIPYLNDSLHSLPELHLFMLDILCRCLRIVYIMSITVKAEGYETVLEQQNFIIFFFFLPVVKLWTKKVFHQSCSLFLRGHILKGKADFFNGHWNRRSELFQQRKWMISVIPR